MGPWVRPGAFDCGEPTCNEWLVHHAATSVQAGVCAVYLLLERIGDSTRVVGYYAINPTQVVRDVTPGNTTRGWPQTVPGWKLGKLAVHLDLREAVQWGRQLLRDALETIVRMADAGGGKVTVVDADDPGLLAFYSRNGFKPTGVDGDLSLPMKLSTRKEGARRVDAS